MVNSPILDKLGQDIDVSVQSWKENLLPRVQKVVSEHDYSINTCIELGGN